MHTLMDFRGSIPTFVHLTEGAVHDSKIMDKMPVEANSYYLMDKGYVKFDSLYQHFHLNNAFFVTRAKGNMLYEVIDSREVDQSAGLSSDETIKLTGPLTSQKYPDSLRLVVYEDFSTNTVYRFSMQQAAGKHTIFIIIALYQKLYFQYTRFIEEKDSKHSYGTANYYQKISL